MSPKSEDFAEERYVKIVGISGDYHYGFIEKVTDRGFHLLISLFEEGDSAVEYEAAAGTLAQDWEEQLTDSEKAIIGWLSSGFSTNDIAVQLSIAAATVRGHIRELRLRLGLDNREQLIAYAQGMEKRLSKEE